jgi:hypothetical protein
MQKFYCNYCNTHEYADDDVTSVVHRHTDDVIIILESPKGGLLCDGRTGKPVSEVFIRQDLG